MKSVLSGILLLLLLPIASLSKASSNAEGYDKNIFFVSSPDSLEIIQSLIQDAILHRRASEFSQALEILPVIRSFGERYNEPDVLEWGYLLSGHSYLGLSQFERAEYYYRKTFTILEEDNYESLGAVYNNLGNLFRVTGEYDRAIDYLTESIFFNEKLDDSNVPIAINHITISQLYSQQLQFSRALYHVAKAIELYDNQSKDVLYISISNLRGRISEQIGLYDQALTSFYTSLAAAEEIGSLPHKADSYFNIATAYQGLGDIDNTQKYYQKYLPYLERMESRVRWNRYSTISNFYSSIGEHDVALEYIEIAGEHLEDLEISYNNVVYLRNKGDVLHRAGKYNDAEEYFNLIFENLDLNPVDVHQPVNYWSRARNLFKLDRDEAFNVSELAVLATERERMDTGFSESVTSGFFTLYHPFFVMLSYEYAKDGNYSQASDILEMARARSFRDDLILSNVPVQFQEGLSDDLKAIQEIRAELAEIDRKILELGLQAGNDLLNDRAEILTRLNVLTDEFYSKNPGLTANLELPIASIRQFQQELGRNDAILEFGVSEEYSFALLTTRNGFYFHPINASSSKLADYVTEVRAKITQVRPIDEVNGLIDELSKLLLGDLPINDYSNLLVINDGPLNYLPLDLLRIDDDYLINSITVRYTPSLSVKELLYNRPVSGSSRIKAIVNPTFGKTNDFVAIFRDGVRPLPFTVLEGQFIAEQFGSYADVISGTDASKSHVFNADLTQYRYLHFGTHGAINDVIPDLSGLLFSYEENDDGYLRFTEMYDLRLNSELVMLSACNTGVGKLVSGEGVMGLQRAFLYAGARNVGVSLWSIFDRSAAMVMREFYSGLTIGTSTSQNNYAYLMRNARLNVKNQPGFEHPVHWAPFVITGI